jgi:hypothetical protein
MHYSSLGAMADSQRTTASADWIGMPGGYSYRMFTDRSIQIIGGPTGVGRVLRSGAAYDAIVDQINSGIVQPSAPGTQTPPQPVVRSQPVVRLQPVAAPAVMPDDWQPDSAALNDRPVVWPYWIGAFAVATLVVGVGYGLAQGPPRRRSPRRRGRR